MEHERPWSLTHGCVVSCVLVNQGSQLPFCGFFPCHGCQTLSAVMHHISWQQCLFINQITCPCEHTCCYEPAVQSDVKLGCSCTTQHINPFCRTLHLQMCERCHGDSDTVYAHESHQVMFALDVRRPSASSMLRVADMLQTALSATIFIMCEAICSALKQTKLMLLTQKASVRYINRDSLLQCSSWDPVGSCHDQSSAVKYKGLRQTPHRAVSKQSTTKRCKQKLAHISAHK